MKLETVSDDIEAKIKILINENPNCFNDNGTCRLYSFGEQNYCPYLNKTRYEQLPNIKLYGCDKK